ncbi:hypothetical protein AAF712_014519 [Marasmius tenuissimus]|uniref:Enoyl reductase (ER) domain-containing protein n=1 Tax=Marasmius tenuissimus TaxID=585030 RepID=A0ABR2ZEC5_9AGAR
MSQQKVLGFPTTTSEPVYTLTTKPIPAPGPTEVLVKLEGSALQPLEWRIPVIAPLFNSLKFPASAGVDGAGVVESVGSEVKRLKKGDRVLFQGWLEYDYTTFQQYALAPEIFVAKLPSSLSTLEASSIPSAVVTAAAGFSHPESAIPSPTEVGQHLKSFFDGRGGAGVKPFWEDGAEGVKAGEPILILGGSSSVGQLVIQIAKHLGYSPIITTSSLKHTDHLKSLGATHVLDRSTPDVSLVSDIQAITQNKPIELVYDAVGAITQAQIDLLAPGGAFVLADPMALGPKFVFNDGRRLLLVGGAVHGFKEFGASLFEKLESLLERGVIKPLRVEKLPGGLNGILDGLARLQRNEVSGIKLVVDPSET